MFNFFAHVNYRDMITLKQWRTIKKWAKTSVQFGFEVFALFTFLSEWFAGINIGSEMNFHFIRYLWNEFCVFISPSLWRRDIKHTTSVINTVWNENLLHILFITCLTLKNVRKTEGFITDFTAKNATTSGRYLWCHRRTATFQPIKMLPGAMS